MHQLLPQLGTKEHKWHTDMILSKNPRDFTFDTTLKRLSETFGEKSSLFNIRCQCLKLGKNEADELLTLASIVNREFLATFQTEIEAWIKHLMVIINGNPVRLQLDTTSDLSVISKRTRQMIGQPPMITSDKGFMNISGGFLRLTVLDQELYRLQRDGVLQPVNYPELAAPLMTVKKTTGQVVLAKDYMNNREKWTLRRVHPQRCDVIHEIRVNSDENDGGHDTKIQLAFF
ncbi:unnamed protein product [Dibothriocephalus latus]|uniref:Peptidase A2 domain-containing protein n=1 Tax=Dibothriocephalus latus TaxID=60516 RepID=A0A3P7LU36_DIBLA|nr:unnamed protein product [Dibothriocephalus latus]